MSEHTRMPATTVAPAGAPIPRRAARALAGVGADTFVRLANVQSEGVVQHEKLKEVDRLVHTAMTGQAMLAKWRDTLATADPFLADDLKFFGDIAKFGKGDILAATINRFGRENGC